MSLWDKQIAALKVGALGLDIQIDKTIVYSKIKVVHNITSSKGFLEVLRHFSLLKRQTAIIYAVMCM